MADPWAQPGDLLEYLGPVLAEGIDTVEATWMIMRAQGVVEGIATVPAEPSEAQTAALTEAVCAQAEWRATAGDAAAAGVDVTIGHTRIGAQSAAGRQAQPTAGAVYGILRAAGLLPTSVDAR